jgi:hypothetical protein
MTEEGACVSETVGTDGGVGDRPRPGGSDVHQEEGGGPHPRQALQPVESIAQVRVALVIRAADRPKLSFG